MNTSLHAQPASVRPSSVGVNRRSFIKAGGAAVAAGSCACAAAVRGADRLALLGGTPVISRDRAAANKRIFHWPIVNEAMRRVNDSILCEGRMSGIDVAAEFERKFAEWQGTKYASSAPNGTAALNAAFFAIGLGPGDELICPSITYWASCMGAIHLGANVVFCDVKADDCTMDPASFEAHITPRTKAVVVVHAYAQPCDMDPIMSIARRHGIKVVEDVSHAQGGRYKGRKLGTIGDCGAMSLMTGKSFAIGEGGMFVTDDPELYRRVVRWGQYERISRCWRPEEYAATKILPFGGVKNRLNQCSAAIGIEQLKKYDAEIAEIARAHECFWGKIAGVAGLANIFPSYPQSDKAGWYYARAHYSAEAFGGVPVASFVAALNAEVGRGDFNHGCNFPLHQSSVFFDEDMFRNGRPPATRNLPAGVSPRDLTGRLPVSESIAPKLIGMPWFKHCDADVIALYAEAVAKVAANVHALRDWKPAAPAKPALTGWSSRS